MPEAILETEVAKQDIEMRGQHIRHGPCDCRSDGDNVRTDPCQPPTLRPALLPIHQIGDDRVIEAVAFRSAWRGALRLRLRSDSDSDNRCGRDAVGVHKASPYSSSSISWKQVNRGRKGSGMEQEMGVLKVIGFCFRRGENRPSN